MRIARALLPGLALASAISVGCGLEVEGDPQRGEPTSRAVATPSGTAPAGAAERPRGTYVFQPELATSKLAGGVASRTIYVNFDGGTFTPGFTNNSSTNTSSVPNQTSTIAPWGTPSERAAVLSCVREIWSPFAVTVTDVDPGSTPHIESVTAGYPSDVGMGDGVGGVSPFSCGVIERSIVYSFAEVYGTAYRSLCETVAQEVAHSYGLDHEYLCEDPMTYLFNCGNKSFQNINAQCGEYEARACQCGGNTQNSVAILTSLFGAGNAPRVTITSPSDGAVVSAGFQVQASITAQGTIQRVEMYLNGSLQGSVAGPPYTFNAPADLANGDYSVEVRARDENGEGTGSVTVRVRGGDSAPGDLCSNALPLQTLASQTVNGSTSSSLNDYEGSCAGAGPENVYAFTLSASATFTADADGYDTVLYLRSGCENAGSELLCNDDRTANDRGSTITRVLNAGSYFLFVDSYDTGGDYSLSVQFECSDLADDDSDGIPNCRDGCPDDPDKTEPGVCGCGESDVDSDSDGTPDCDDSCPDDPNNECGRGDDGGDDGGDGGDGNGGSDSEGGFGGCAIAATTGSGTPLSGGALWALAAACALAVRRRRRRAAQTR